MTRTDDLVIAYLETLHRHRVLVAAAYHQGRLVRVTPSLVPDETIAP